MPVDTTTILMLLGAIVTILIGFAGLLIPALPGPLLIFAGLMLAAWSEDFNGIGTTTIIILVILTIMAYVVDFLAGALGAKHFGGGKRAILGAAIGAVVGVFFGIPGIFAGPFLGAVIGQLTDKSDLHTAGRAGIGTWIGFVFGIAAKIAISFTMIGIFLLARFI